MPDTKTRLMVLASPLGATQHISFAQPLRRARQPVPIDLTMPLTSQVRGKPSVRHTLWKTQPHDVVVLSRFYDANAIDYVNRARASGTPTILHLDDDLLDVPMALGEDKFRAYNQPMKIAMLREMLAQVDLVYASTPNLARRLKEHGVTNRIHAGTLYCSVDPDDITEPLPSTMPTIGYMGTGGHSRDLAMVMPVIVALMERLPTLRFETFGSIDPPGEMARFGGRYQHHEGLADYDAFIRKLASLGWWIGLAPLEDIPFNRCKADTKWVEYTRSGIAVVASDVGVYSHACAEGAGLLATDPQQWQEAIAALLTDATARRAQLAAARRRLHTHYTHDRLAAQIAGVVEQARQAHAARGRPTGPIGRQPLADWRPTAPATLAADSPRVLFVANSLIPTLQLSFLKPLATDVAQGRLASLLLTADDIAARQPMPNYGDWMADDLRDWLRAELQACAPTHIVFCRYSGRFADVFVEHARSSGIPVVFHVDDDLLNVPPEIGDKYRMHNEPERLATVRYLLEQADLIYCSTPALMARYRELGFTRPMVAGEVYCASRVYNRVERRPVRRVGYMGFDHAHDFALALPAIETLLDTCPEVRFELFGSIPRPQALDRFGERVTLIPPVRVYGDFLERFASLQWDVGLCPLATTPFNRVKANTKWVEYTAVGAAVVATRGMAYDDCAADDCGILVDTPDQWTEALLRLAADEALRERLVRRAQDKLEQVYTDERLRQQVWSVLERATATCRTERAA